MAARPVAGASGAGSDGAVSSAVEAGNDSSQASANTAKSMATEASSTTPALTLSEPSPSLAESSAVKTPPKPSTTTILPQRPRLNGTISTTSTIRPPGAIMSGKQEHYLKRELISQQAAFEITELASPTALQRFGAPFRSDYGEVAPVDSDLPLLRYIFVNFVRNFPFLDQAHEKEFWQDKLQVFLELFANKHISSSEDRLEVTKRRKLALKAQKVVELMMVSGIPTASGYEQRIRFAEMEVVDRSANEQGLLVNRPEGNAINGWDVNIAGVRTTMVKRTVRYHTHAEFILRVHRANEPAKYMGKRYGDFARLHKRLRTELPGKVLAPLPRKNKTSSMFTWAGDDDDDDASSVSSEATLPDEGSGMINASASSLRAYASKSTHRRSTSAVSNRSARSSPRPSSDLGGRPSRDRQPVSLYRENQRVSLRAFLRTSLQNQQIAESQAMAEFLGGPAVKLNEEELLDVDRRREMDEKRLEEQRKFYEVARQRARELDVYMERFRRDIVERNGLSKLFGEIKEKEHISDLSIEYQRFAEWLRIEVAATIYHIFLAEDNSPEMFAQAKRIHSMLPYTALKQVIRFANPALVMSGVLDLFLAQPFGSRSLAQRVFGMALNDGIRSFQKSIDALLVKIDDPILGQKLKAYVDAPEDVKGMIQSEALVDEVDPVVAILRSDQFGAALSPPQVGKIFNAYVAWNNAVANVDDEMKAGAELFALLKQLLKLYIRQRDKAMMLSVIEEPVTLHLFRDLFTIFYEPLIRVYKSANVYDSVTDFAAFADDAIKVVERAQRQDISADPNETVQSFIDLCARHEDRFYRFVHEVHIHDNGLFTALMGWLENILEFLRHGPRAGGKLDMNALVQGAIDIGAVNREAALAEVDDIIAWQRARKDWHQNKTRQKLAAESGDGLEAPPGMDTFKTSDFGLNESDLQDLNYSSDSSDVDANEHDEQNLDPIVAERNRRARAQGRLRRTAGEPVKPPVPELSKLLPTFNAMLRQVLAD